ncbi:hypothetical protein GCM10011367_05020 [Marinicauda pacifica]|uniref:STAS/SEC14 domain-containing protein n=1 Tax=Marinicauda pacifica TaxID=1133559 RepID=A0A4S2HDV8_9PROT|nr:hypothetical protein [Marinicauda pacifica]TGY94176.1 hypothetical protein E5162_02540 [Marinicauda pacifica]GGE33560.1 hypothetical protein GCM10011367_05020 [Marinicauda pacifica]
MSRSLEIDDGIILSRRVGSVDWEEAMESFSLYSAMVEDSGARKLLMDMSEAEIHIPAGEARGLAQMFVRSTPDSLSVAAVLPTRETGYRFIQAFQEVVAGEGRTIAVVETEDQARAFLRSSPGDEAEAKNQEKGGPVARFFAGLLGRA